MTSERARFGLWLAALLDALLGVVVVLSSWDGLYSDLRLPKPSPAVLAQITGFAMIALAYLLWIAGRDPALRRHVAAAAAGANGAAALTIGLWLLKRDNRDLHVTDTGIVVLAVLAVVLAGCAVMLAVTARRAAADAVGTSGA